MLSASWKLAALSLFSLASSSAYVPARRDCASTALAVGGPPDTLVVQPAASRIHWAGARLRGAGKHSGDVRFLSGTIIIRHQRLVSGSFVVDMRGVDPRFPTATFTASDLQRIADSTWQLSGTLEMLGVVLPLTFSTDVQWVELGHLTATSKLVLAREGWGVALRDARLASDPAEGDVSVSISLDARRKGTMVAGR